MLCSFPFTFADIPLGNCRLCNWRYLFNQSQNLSANKLYFCHVPERKNLEYNELSANILNMSISAEIPFHGAML